MKNAELQSDRSKSLNLLSGLLLLPRKGGGSPAMERLRAELMQLSRDEFDDMLALACTNHVVVRALEVFRDVMFEARDEARIEWANHAIAAERGRIETALIFLDAICKEFHDQAQPVAVIKSLDHWPDLGSDLDLYTDAEPSKVIVLMMSCFGARMAPRSWGDRLACKWNFIIPGIPELVEIHVGRLGQTGEQFSIASSLIARSRRIQIGDLEFRVPSVSDRVMLSTLQRMYRHFYFRLCDIVDTASLAESGSIDYAGLKSQSTAAGIWEGVATYLAIVSDYVASYRGVGLELPPWVLSAARFRGDEVYFAKDFLRIPILPQSALLYGSQLAATLRRRQIESGARLTLLPWLATAALLGQKITGSDKGIW